MIFEEDSSSNLMQKWTLHLNSKRRSSLPIEIRYTEPSSETKQSEPDRRFQMESTRHVFVFNCADSLECFQILCDI